MRLAAIISSLCSRRESSLAVAKRTVSPAAGPPSPGIAETGAACRSGGGADTGGGAGGAAGTGSVAGDTAAVGAGERDSARARDDSAISPGRRAERRCTRSGTDAVSGEERTWPRPSTTWTRLSSRWLEASSSRRFSAARTLSRAWLTSSISERSTVRAAPLRLWASR